MNSKLGKDEPSHCFKLAIEIRNINTLWNTHTHSINSTIIQDKVFLKHTDLHAVMSVALCESTPLATPEDPPVIPTEDHATDEEKLASSVTNQKPWTYQGVANELAEDPQDYPQPSDLSAFVNDNNFNSPTKEPDCDPSYEIEYMEKIGCSSPVSTSSITCLPAVQLELSFDEVDVQFSTGTKSVHPAMRNLASNLESCSPSPEKSKQKEVELLTMSPPEEPVDSTDVLLDRLSRNAEPGEELDYLESDLAETNPPVFAQKLQQMETLSPEDVSISKIALYHKTAVREGDQGPYHNQRDLDSALGIAREEIVDKEREVAEWQRKYEESRQEVVEMRRIVAEYEKTIAQMIAHCYHPCADSGAVKTRTCSPPKRVPSADRFFHTADSPCSRLRATESEDNAALGSLQASLQAPGQTTGVAGARASVGAGEQGAEGVCVCLAEDEQREKSLSHHTIQQLILEKDQALADLNSVEKSLADLFRRYEKMKEVLDGFRKNEEVLKRCAQEYLARVKKEEQRYHALKIHAEEKLDKASADIAHVRSKAMQEQAAYQASLRKEQMRVDSLERTLEQKRRSRSEGLQPLSQHNPRSTSLTARHQPLTTIPGITEHSFRARRIVG
ncbi:UNVERIFIED_CONTAM: hypothetical protein FKN15_007369 [Acipenser sinensis]